MDSKPAVIEESPIPMYELKEEMQKIIQRDKEPNFRVQKTEEYLATFLTIDPKQGRELLKELNSLSIPRIKPEHLYKIIDIMPSDVDSVKLILQGYTLQISQENMKKIADIVKKYI